MPLSVEGPPIDDGPNTDIDSSSKKMGEAGTKDGAVECDRDRKAEGGGFGDAIPASSSRRGIGLSGYGVST